MGVGQPLYLGRGVPRRRALPVLGAEARLRHAVPAAVPLLLRQLDRRSARRVPARSAPGALLPRLLLGDDAADVRGRADERRLDGGRSASSWRSRSSAPRRASAARSASCSSRSGCVIIVETSVIGWPKPDEKRDEGVTRAGKLEAQGRFRPVVQLHGVLPVRDFARPARADRGLLPGLGRHPHRGRPSRGRSTLPASMSG